MTKCLFQTIIWLAVATAFGYFWCMFVLADLKDDKGESPLDVALNEDNFTAAYYLISCGYGSSDDKAKLLCMACKEGKIKAVTELVEKHKVDVIREYLYLSCL